MAAGQRKPLCFLAVDKNYVDYTGNRFVCTAAAKADEIIIDEKEIHREEYTKRAAARKQRFFSYALPYLPRFLNI